MIIKSGIGDIEVLTILPHQSAQFQVQNEFDYLDYKILETIKPLYLDIFSRFSFSKLKSLIKFCQENKIKTPIVTSISKEGEVEYADIRFQFLPASAYAFTVGKNTLDMRINREY